MTEIKKNKVWRLSIIDKIPRQKKTRERKKRSVENLSFKNENERKRKKKKLGFYLRLKSLQEIQTDDQLICTPILNQ